MSPILRGLAFKCTQFSFPLVKLCVGRNHPFFYCIRQDRILLNILFQITFGVVMYALFDCINGYCLVYLQSSGSRQLGHVHIIVGEKPTLEHLVFI